MSPSILSPAPSPKPSPRLHSTSNSSPLAHAHTSSPSNSSNSASASSNPSSSPRSAASSSGGFSKMVSDLSRRISKRQSPEELSQKNILPVESPQHTIAPSIVQAKHALEVEKTKNLVNRRLSNRPTRDDLKLRNIIKGSNENMAAHTEEDDDDDDCEPVTAEESPDSAETTIPSPSSENYYSSFKGPKTFEKKQEVLKSILKKRPEKSQLQEMRILKGSDLSLVEAIEKERKKEVEETLTSHLMERKDRDSLRAAKILFFSDEVDVGTTYKKTEYNRKPDDDLTFKRLTPTLKTQIREELNQYKKTEMLVHEDSIQNTCFH